MKHLYVHIGEFSHENVLSNISDLDDINNFISNCVGLVETIEKEHCHLLYSAEDVNEFCKFFNGLVGNPYLTSLEDQFSDILRNAKAFDNTENNFGNRYFWWDLCSEKTKELRNGFLYNSVGICNKFPDGEHLIILPESLREVYSCKNSIPIIIDNNIGSADIPCLIKLEYHFSSEKISEWIKNSRLPLKMNKNNKHGENGQGGHSRNKGNKVSKLYTTIEKAQLLLDSAIADKRYNKKNRYNYDTENSKFIAFYYEGDTPQNQYHGFHYDTMEEAESEIYPNSVFMQLKGRFNL